MHDTENGSAAILAAFALYRRTGKSWTVAIVRLSFRCQLDRRPRGTLSSSIVRKINSIASKEKHFEILPYWSDSYRPIDRCWHKLRPESFVWSKTSESWSGDWETRCDKLNLWNWFSFVELRNCETLDVVVYLWNPVLIKLTVNLALSSAAQAATTRMIPTKEPQFIFPNRKYDSNDSFHQFLRFYICLSSFVLWILLVWHLIAIATTSSLLKKNCHFSASES